MNIHYTETNRFRIVPLYQGHEGFDVVDKGSGEVVAHTKMLYEAEGLILSSKKILGRTTIGSAAEVKHY